MSESTSTVAIPPEIQARLDKLDELERGELERKGEFEKLSKQAEERASREVAKRDVRIKALETSTLRNAAESAIRDARGDVEGLLPHVLPRLGFSTDGVSVVVLDEANAGTPRKGRSGRSMSASDLVDELKGHGSLGRLFESASGSGPFRVPGQGEMRLSAEESKDPALYAMLKAKKERGEISTVYDHLGRRLI